ncbi:MAG TPA: hypothetical protein V6D47_09450 [Oscillatoriaceae cyanobacterium]
MKRWLTPALVLLLAQSAFAETLPPASVSMALEPASHRLLAMSRFWADVPAGSRELVLPLAASLQASRINVAGHPVHFEHHGDRLIAHLPFAGPKRVLIEVYDAGRPLVNAPDGRLADLGPEGLVLGPDAPWYAHQAIDQGALVRVRLPANWRLTAPARVSVSKGVATLTFASHTPVTLAAGPYTRTPGQPNLYAAHPASQALLALLGRHGLALPKETLVALPPGFRGIAAPHWRAIAAPNADACLVESALGASGTSPADRQWLQAGFAAYLNELQHGRDAHDLLGNYEAFVRAHPEADLPLTAPIAPNSPAWAAEIGDKAPFVWSLLHDQLGDAAFWKLLQQPHGDWRGLLAAAGPVGATARAWIEGHGLPRLRLEDLHVAPQGDDTLVSGVLVQDGPVFRVPLELALETMDGVQRVPFTTFAERMPFHFVATSRPLRVLVDPTGRSPIVRRDSVAVRDALSAADGLIVYGTGGKPADTAAEQKAARALHDQLWRTHRLNWPVLADKQVTPADQRRTLALVGRPDTNAIADALSSQFPVRFVEGKALWWQGRVYRAADAGTVQAIANPANPDETVVMFAALAPSGLPAALRFASAADSFTVFQGRRLLESGEALNTCPDLQAVLY